MHIVRYGLRAVWRLTHDGCERDHQRVELGDAIRDIVEWERFPVFAVEEAKVVPQYDHTKNSYETEPSPRGVLEELKRFSQVLNLPQNKHAS